MRYYIYISVLAFLSAFCFSQANGQCTSPFGTNNPACFSKTAGGLWMPFYTSTDSNDVLGPDATGKIVLRKKSNAPSFDTSLYLKKSDTSRSGMVATYYYVDSITANTPVPTWQETINEGRTGDSVLISDNLYIGTEENYKPSVLRVIGDSRDASVFAGIPPTKIWPALVAQRLGWYLNNDLAQPSTFFMNELPRYNPLDDSSAVMDLILTDKIKDVTGLTDSNYWLCVTRSINDLFYYTKGGGSNYTPVNFGRDYRIFMDSIVDKGWNMDRVIIMGPKYVASNSTQVTQDSVFRWIDTCRQIATDYGARFFNAFTWEQSRGAATLLGGDNFHENQTGHVILAEGILHTIRYRVPRNNQSLAVNDTIEANKIIFRGSDTLTLNSAPLFANGRGEVVAAYNQLIRNHSLDSEAQAAYINISQTAKVGQIDATGLNSVSMFVANNTAIRGKAASNGAMFIDASQNNTGAISIRATSSLIINPMGASQSVAFVAPIVNAGTMSGGNGLQVGGRLAATATTSRLYMNIAPTTGWAKVMYGGKSYFADANTTTVSAQESPAAILQVIGTNGFLQTNQMTGLQAEALVTTHGAANCAGAIVNITNGNGVSITSTGLWYHDGAAWAKLN